MRRGSSVNGTLLNLTCNRGGGCMRISFIFYANFIIRPRYDADKPKDRPSAVSAAQHSDLFSFTSARHLTAN